MRLWKLTEEFTEQCQALTDEQALFELMAAVSRELGFSYFALVHTLAFHHDAPHFIKMISYPPWWRERFEQERLYLNDPMLTASERAGRGFGWHEVWRFVDREPRFIRILDVANRQGVGGGFTLPVRIAGEPTGSCSFATRAGVALPSFACLHSAGILGSFAFERARVLRGCSTRRAHVPHLSPRQLDCLLLIVRGCSDKAIARQLGLGPDTVRGYLKALRLLLGVSTRGEMTVRALRLGIVGFDDAIPPSG